MINEEYSTKEYINKYIKIRNLNKDELFLQDVLKMLKSKYKLPTSYQIKEFLNEVCKFASINSKTINDNKGEYVRIFKLKRSIHEMTNSPIISYSPLIIDMKKYKKQKDITQNYFLEQGNYKIKEIVGNVAFLLPILKNKNNESTSTSVRILLNDDVLKYIRKGDVLDLMITRKLFMINWEIVKVYDCIPESML